MRWDTNLFFIILPFLIILSGCSAVGVPMTFNPEKKLRYAEVLFNDSDRPLPAEPLIYEAIMIYKNKNDEVGLAKAYRTYAYFLQSPTLKRWEEDYQRYDFMDKTVTLNNRYEKALEYWINALQLFEKNSKYAEASNVYFNMATLYHHKFMNNKMACANLEKSLISHKKSVVSRY